MTTISSSNNNNNSSSSSSSSIRKQQAKPLRLCHEPSVLNIPLERVREQCRGEQREIEKEIATVTKAITGLAEKASKLDRAADPAKAIAGLSKLYDRLAGLKQKLASLRGSRKEIVNTLHKRVQVIERGKLPKLPKTRHPFLSVPTESKKDGNGNGNGNVNGSGNGNGSGKGDDVMNDQNSPAVEFVHGNVASKGEIRTTFPAEESERGKDSGNISKNKNKNKSKSKSKSNNKSSSAMKDQNRHHDRSTKRQRTMLDRDHHADGARDRKGKKTTQTSEKPPWYPEDAHMGILLVSHLARRGFRDSAYELASDLHLQDVVEVEEYAALKETRDAILKGNDEPALAWCKRYRSRLRRLGSNLEFLVHRKRTLELAKDGDEWQAMLYARQYLAQVAQNNADELKRIMGAIVFPDAVKGTLARYKPMFEADLRQELASQFTRESERTLGITSNISLLDVLARVGIAAYHTRSCFGEAKAVSSALSENSNDPPSSDPPSNDPPSNDPPIVASSAQDSSTSFIHHHMYPLHQSNYHHHQHQEQQQDSGPLSSSQTSTGSSSTTDSSSNSSTVLRRNQGGSTVSTSISNGNSYTHSVKTVSGSSKPVLECPACSPVLRVITRHMPYTNIEHSMLICRIRGTVMDEYNPPVCLPNGQVYSEGAVRDLAAQSKSGSSFSCPVTGRTFTLSQIRKVYLV